MHFKYDVIKQGQSKPDSQRNVKSVEQMVAVKPEKILILEGNNKEWKNEIAFWLQIPQKYHLKIQSNI